MGPPPTPPPPPRAPGADLHDMIIALLTLVSIDDKPHTALLVGLVTLNQSINNGAADAQKGAAWPSSPAKPCCCNLSTIEHILLRCGCKPD